MTRSLTIVIAAALLLTASSCHRAKPDPQAALDDAFKAGLLTQDEYNAKRADIDAAAAASASAPASGKATEAPGAAPKEVAPKEKPLTVNSVVAPSDSMPPARAASTPAPKRPAAPPPVASSKATPTPSPETAYEKEDRGDVEPAEHADAKAPVPAPLKGCEDEEFKSGGAKSEARFFAASPDAVHRAAVAALESLDFNIRRDNKNEVEATKKRGIGVVIGAGGERVTLKFHKQERNGVNGTSVEGETRKNFVGRLAQRTWTDAVLAQMGCKLREDR